MIQAYMLQLADLRAKIEKDTKKIQKMEQKLSISLKGYQHKLSVSAHTGSGEQIPGTYNHLKVENLNKTNIDLGIFIFICVNRKLCFTYG